MLDIKVVFRYNMKLDHISKYYIMKTTTKPRNLVAKDLTSGKYNCRRHRTGKDYIRSMEKNKTFKEIRQYAI